MINLNIQTLWNPKSVEAKTHAYVEPEFHPSSLHQYLAQCSLFVLLSFCIRNYLKKSSKPTKHSYFI